MSPSFAHPLPFCLVIDQSLTMRKILEIEFRRAGYPSCASFAEPVEALQALAQQHLPVPDVALVSWRLPRLDGVEVIRQMKLAGYHTACVMLLDQDLDRPLTHLKARLAGAQKVLVKPFTMQQLHAQLASLNSTRAREHGTFLPFASCSGPFLPSRGR